MKIALLVAVFGCALFWGVAFGSVAVGCDTPTIWMGLGGSGLLTLACCYIPQITRKP